MIERLRFAFAYALRNIVRDRRRAAFTLLSVAVGVASVVALRALGLMLTDALTSNAQAFLRGDLRVTDTGMDGGFVMSIFNSQERSHPFSAENIPAIEAWAAERNIAITFTLNGELMQVAVIGEYGRAGPPALTMSVFVDPAVYPFYDTIRADKPARALLGDLFTTPNAAVLSQRLASQIGAEVGDQVRVGSANVYFTVTGIVPDTAESSLASPQNLLFSFIYLNRAEQSLFGLDDLADRAYLKLPPEADPQAVEDEIANWPRRSDRQRYSHWLTVSAGEVLEENVEIADAISRFVLVLSLVGLVIGGVGIINTMVVAINRRSLEIAVLKTLGLHSLDISLLVLAEAALAGFFGSLLGAVLGMLLSYVARDLGQQAFAIGLPWRPYLDPILIGTALGLVVTLFFSLLPMITAARVRPKLVLREDDVPMLRAGALWTIISFIVLIVGFGLLIDLIVGSYRFARYLRLPPPLTPGITATLGTFIFLAVLFALNWVLVWLLSKLPSFRNANLQLAIRGLATHRTRTAFSLLALIIGMTALSGTLIMTRSINILLYTSISQPLGGNVVILPLSLVQGTVRSRLDSIPAVNGYREIRFPGRLELEAIDGVRDYERWFALARDDAQSSMRRASLNLVLGVNTYGNPPRGQLVAGRFIGPEDAGQAVITIPYLPELEAHGVTIGSQITLRIGGRVQDFEVVGIVAPGPSTGLIPFSLNDSALQVPLDMMPRQNIPFDFVIVDVQPEAVREVMAAVGAIPGVFIFDVAIFDSIISRLMNQMAALPLLVAGLSLFAASALIATTVALATMERRRQIAILKAIGVSRWQALGQLLAENSLVGIAGGVISLLPTLLILALVPALTEGIVHMPLPTDLVILMLALAVLVTIAATLITAWPAATEKPLNALRYE